MQKMNNLSKMPVFASCSNSVSRFLESEIAKEREREKKEINYYAYNDNSFYNLTLNKFKDFGSSMNNNVVAMGYTVCRNQNFTFCPVAIDDEGNYIVLTPESANGLNIVDFIKKLSKKYGVFSVFIDPADLSVFGYGGIGGLFKNLKIEVLVSPVRKINEKIMLANALFNEKVMLDYGVRLIKGYRQELKYVSETEYDASAIAEGVMNVLLGVDVMFNNAEELKRFIF